MAQPKFTAGQMIVGKINGQVRNFMVNGVKTNRSGMTVYSLDSGVGFFEETVTYMDKRFKGC